MAGAETITARILSDARDDARHTLDEAQKRVDEMMKTTQAEIETLLAEGRAKIRTQVEAQSERLHNMAALERRKADLGERRERMDEVFERALARMRAMSDSEYAQFVAAILKDNAQPGDEIMREATDTRLTESVLIRSGVPGLKLTTTQEKLGGGCIIRRGGLEMNATFPVLLRESRAQAEAEVAGILFGRKEG